MCDQVKAPAYITLLSNSNYQILLKLVSYMKVNVETMFRKGNKRERKWDGVSTTELEKGCGENEDGKNFFTCEDGEN